MEEKKDYNTYYERKVEELNLIKRVKDKEKFIEEIDFSVPIEKDSDATIIKELRILKEAIELRIIKDPEQKEKRKLFSRRDQIESFWDIQPFFYDSAKIFWLWEKDKFRWVKSDEIDFLNLIQKELGIETIDSKIRIELIEGFKQVGREHRPKEIKKSWIQFKDKIYDIETDEILEANYEYFVSNPIPWKVGECEDTKIMDGYFTDWVGESNINQLYELISYCATIDTFMQRIFALCGGGSNGKGTFIKALIKFLGKENCVASEMRSLSEDKFEPAVLYKKLVCVMGEVSYGDLKNTNQIKKLSGEDLISFQFKGKMPFTEENTATCICLTNSLPATPDKSVGFYRKWHIIDFPNQFDRINKDIINEIPDVEFENLAFKCIKILKELHKKNKFEGEGNFEERIKRYEEHSNPVLRFVEDYCEENIGQSITLREFTNACNDHLKKSHLRILTATQIGKVLREEGFLVGNRKINDISAVVILNLSLKNYSNYQNYQRVLTPPYKDLISHLDSFTSSNSKNNKLDNFTDDEIEKTGFTREQLNEMLNSDIPNN